MIIPSIDLMNGSTVQLVGGKEHALDAGHPAPILERFSLAGEVAVIDLDAALGRGSNRALIEPLLKTARCRVGGGIRDLDTARAWLDAGASKVILGTAAKPEILRELPRERVIAALDAVDGEVVVKGWTEGTGRTILDRIAELREFVGGFLVTFVEREGRLGGTDLDAARAIVEAAGSARVTIAGGVTTAAEIATLDALGADAQVGMAIYTGRLGLADAIAAPLRTDRADGLWPTVVADEHGIALGLCYSNADSVREAVDTKRGVYWSRSRNALWRKGETSGSTQELLAIDLDCDRDALRFTVRQTGSGFCHLNTRTCWGEDRGLSALARTIDDRFRSAPKGSYTHRLFTEPGLVGAKLREEAQELSDAIDAGDPDGAAWEAADVIYFALVAARRAGVSLERIERELDARARTVSRRTGDAKPGFAPRDGDAR